MGAQFLAGIVFGMLIYLAMWIADRFVDEGNRWQQVMANTAGFIVGLLAGYGIVHLIFVGFLQYAHVPLGGAGALSALLHIILLISSLRLLSWAIERKSRDFQAVVGFIGFVLILAALVGVDYVVFVWLLRFREMPSGNYLPLVGALGGYVIMGLMLRLVGMVIERSASPGATTRPGNILLP